jgi:hypothetical protein
MNFLNRLRCYTDLVESASGISDVVSTSQCVLTKGAALIFSDLNIFEFL